MNNTTDWAAISQKLHQDCRQLERELAEITKQRDELIGAIRKHKETLPVQQDYCDVELYKTLDQIEKGGEA